MGVAVGVTTGMSVNFCQRRGVGRCRGVPRPWPRCRCWCSSRRSGRCRRRSGCWCPSRGGAVGVGVGVGAFSPNAATVRLRSSACTQPRRELSARLGPTSPPLPLADDVAKQHLARGCILRVLARSAALPARRADRPQLRFFSPTISQPRFRCSVNCVKNVADNFFSFWALFSSRAASALPLA